MIMYNLHFIKKVLELRKTLSIKKLAEKFDISTRTIQNWEQGKLPTGKRNKLLRPLLKCTTEDKLKLLSPE